MLIMNFVFFLLSNSIFTRHRFRSVNDGVIEIRESKKYICNLVDKKIGGEKESRSSLVGSRILICFKNK